MFLNRRKFEARIVQLCAIAPHRGIEIYNRLNKGKRWWNRVGLGDVMLMLNRLERLGYLDSYFGEPEFEGCRPKFYRSTGKRLPVKQKKRLGKLNLGVEALSIQKLARI